MIGGGHRAMKIYFLLMIISVFIGFSYLPLRTEPKQKTVTGRVPTDSVPA